MQIINPIYKLRTTDDTYRVDGREESHVKPDGPSFSVTLHD
jgi:hypothetical protein